MKKFDDHLFAGTNFFIPAEILNLTRNKATNTGIEDPTCNDVFKTVHCREINQGRRRRRNHQRQRAHRRQGCDGDVQDDDKESEECGRSHNDSESDSVSIEHKYKCDKSTMTETSAYTVKAKPLREDLTNIFPSEMAEAILDLYEKCNGNMDWIIEILMEDGYSLSDNQFEYLSSLQNVEIQETLSQNLVPKEKKKGNCYYGIV